nr:hypothetical protein JVH1_0333 [Rhodococcus sp. JVH1]
MSFVRAVPGAGVARVGLLTEGIQDDGAVHGFSLLQQRGEAIQGGDGEREDRSPGLPPP